MTVTSVRRTGAGVATGPSTLRVWTALATVYVVWGSTYLAIRYAIGADTGERGLPPLLMAALRFGFAGTLMYAWAVRRPAHDGRPDPVGWRQWRAATIVGGALLLGGNGLVTLAENRGLDSGIAAVLVATTPLWVALIARLRGDERLPPTGLAGLVLGFLGVAVLFSAGTSRAVDTVGAGMVLLAALAWGSGSYYSRHAPVPRRPLVMTGMQMLTGAVLLGIVGLARGEWSDLRLADVGSKAWVAFGYLVVFGSMVAFTAYAWLLQNARLSLVTTYAYVNPVVAVVLGTAFLSEPLTVRTLVAAGVIVLGVALIVTARQRALPRTAETAV